MKPGSILIALSCIFILVTANSSAQEDLAVLKGKWI